MTVLVVMPGCPGDKIGHLNEARGMRFDVERYLRKAVEPPPASPTGLPLGNQLLHQALVAGVISNYQRPMRLASVMKPSEELIEMHEDFFMG